MSFRHHVRPRHRARWLKDEQIVAVIVAAMGSALAYVLGGNLYQALATGVAAGALACAAVHLQIFRKRHEVYLKRNGSHGRTIRP